jgi:hypothetical protein
MQTFLPYKELESVGLLDSKRLFNQYNEFLVIRKAVRGEIQAWKNHPACVMWRGFEDGLDWYGAEVYRAIFFRGLPIPEKTFPIVHCPLPEWIGNEEFHRQHRRNLLRKSSFYKFDDTPDDVYVWPINIDGKWVYRKKKVGAKKYEPLTF